MSKTAKIDLMDLPRNLKKNVFKRGYFLLSTKRLTKYWVDLFSLSHLFNAFENADEYYGLLQTMVRDIIVHQKKALRINAIICPRWTRSTEDLFSETLLNICFELLREEPETFGGLTVYELFSAGGKDSYYLNPVNSEYHEEKINAVAFLALDIHFGQIESLLGNGNDLKIESVISIIGRCEPQNRAFSIVPLFDALNGGTPNGEFAFIMNEKSTLHQKLLAGGDIDCKKYIPFEKWKAEYAV